MRCGALLRVLATTFRPEYALRLKRFCQDRLTQVTLAMPPVGKMTVARAWDSSLYIMEAQSRSDDRVRRDKSGSRARPTCRRF